MSRAVSPAGPDAPPPPRTPRPRRRSGADIESPALWTLRLLLVGAIVAPLILGAMAALFSYRSNSERARVTLIEAAAVAEENTVKVLDTHQLVAARIGDALAGLSDAEIRAHEESLHDRLAAQIKDMPEVVAAWAIDASGRELVSARVYPVNPDLDQSGREDFKALQKPGATTFIWALRARTLDQDRYQAFFTVAHRRDAPDGSFAGVVVVAVSGSYFASFYNSLLDGSTEYTASVFRDDGANLAHYPEDGGAGAITHIDDRLVTAIAEKGASGVVVSGSPFSKEGRVVAYRRVGNYPIYVTISRTRAAILGDWLAGVIGYGAILGPAAIGFILLILLALRRTRREQVALARARDAVAERAEVENQLHQAQKMEVVGQLTAGIAHDFNNLLTAISGNIAMAEMNIDKREKAERFIEAAMTGCDRASALVSRLLTFSRREPDDPRPVDVNDVVGGMSDLLSRSLAGNIQRDIRLASEPWPVFVDVNQLENALLNLSLNARDAMPEGGTLTIETSNCQLDGGEVSEIPGLPGGDYVCVSVADTGCGMPPDVVERVFEPFYTTKGPGKGTGLGLSQVYGFVQRSGGQCTIDSEPGRGTRITLYLPRHLGADAPTEPDPGKVPQPTAA